MTWWVPFFLVIVCESLISPYAVAIHWVNGSSFFSCARISGCTCTRVLPSWIVVCGHVLSCYVVQIDFLAGASRWRGYQLLFWHLDSLWIETSKYVICYILWSTMKCEPAYMLHIYFAAFYAFSTSLCDLLTEECLRTSVPISNHSWSAICYKPVSVFLLDKISIRCG